MQHVIGRARLRTQLHFKHIVLYERGSSTSKEVFNEVI